MVECVYYNGEEITVLSNVYMPSDDTFVLLEEALKVVCETDYVLEVGTGSGIISKFLSKKAKSVIATDINPYAVKNARINAVKVRTGHLFANLAYNFDVIVFNPPYLPTLTEGHEPKDWLNKAWDGGPTGTEVIMEFLSEVTNYLAEAGKVLIVVSSLTDLRKIITKMTDLFEEVHIVATKKFQFETLYVLLGSQKCKKEDIKSVDNTLILSERFK
jgi:release factor glutamine methyltransferase